MRGGLLEELGPGVDAQLAGAVCRGDDVLAGGQAQAKRRKTTAERKAEDEAKRAEREGANPDEPWSLQVRPTPGRLTGHPSHPAPCAQ